MMDLLKGFGSEGSVISIMLSAFIIWHLYIRPKLMRKDGKERRKSNPHPAPGNADQCKKHADGLSRCEERIKNVKEKVQEYDQKNREDHQLLFEKIDRLKNKKR